MTNARYTLAIDLAKRTHVACIHDKFNGETSKSIRVPVTKEGFENLKSSDDFDSLYAAGSLRAIGDWLLGLNSTRAYTLKYGGYKQVERR